ncbi:MAG: phage portal protein [Anaerolineae bacterium]|nr:phage portal protein [Anaerolineae bacterium]
MGLLNNVSNWARDIVWGWLNDGRSTMLLTAEEKQKQSLIVLARRYYDGDHDAKLTERQKEWLQQHGSTVNFSADQCAVVVDTVVEREKVIGFEVSGEQADDENSLSKQAWKWWDANRMDANQTEVHRRAERDGETFVLIDWDATEKRPDFVPHQRYVDKSAGGDSYGMWIEYPNDDHLQKPTRAVKQWEEKTDDGKIIRRRTVYYPDRVERFVEKEGKWAEFKENETDVWPTPWKAQDGSPLGIPVMCFRTPNRKSALAKVIPLQDALDKTWLDMLAAGDTSAFQTLLFWGVTPTTDGKEPKDDGSNLLRFAPGQVWSTRTNPADGKADVIPAASLAGLLEMEDRIVIRIASISSTPLSRFLSSKQIAAEGTLKQQEAPLLGKVDERQTLHGNSWEDMIRMGAKLSNAFGGTAFDTEAQISTIWKSAELRNDLAHLQEEQIKSELGVTDEQIWTEMGYKKDQIEDFTKERDKKQADGLRAAAKAAAANQQNAGAGSGGANPGPGTNGKVTDARQAA